MVGDDLYGDLEAEARKRARRTLSEGLADSRSLALAGPI
jgi:hypothetical protein